MLTTRYQYWPDYKLHASLTLTRNSVQVHADTMNRGTKIGRPADIAAVVDEVEAADGILAAGVRERLPGDVASLALLDGCGLSTSEGEDHGENRS
jgi:hypothetical protein